MTAACSASHSAGHTDYRNGAVFPSTVRDWTSSPQKQCSLYCVGVTITDTSVAGAATIAIFGATRVLLRPKFCRNKRMFVVTKHIFCCNKNMLVTTKLWSQQQANICHNKHNFVRTKLLSQQAYFCRDKHAWFSEKHMLVVTKPLSWQKWGLWQLPPMIVPKPMTAACSANHSAGHTDYRNGSLPLHRDWTSPQTPHRSNAVSAVSLPWHLHFEGVINPASLLQVISAVTSLVLCPCEISTTPEYLRSFKR